MFHTHLHLHAALPEGQTGEAWKTFKRNCLSESGEQLGKYFHFFSLRGIKHETWSLNVKINGTYFHAVFLSFCLCFSCGYSGGEGSVFVMSD